MRVVLVHLPMPLLLEEPRHVSPPLGLAYIAASLGDAGHEAIILDAVLQDHTRSWQLSSGQRAYGMQPMAIAQATAQHSPDVIGLSCLFSTQDEVLHAVCGTMRTHLPDVPVVLGGTHPTVFAREFVEAGLADYVIRGEGEQALRDLLSAMLGHDSFESVSGLTWRDGASVRENPVDRIQSLDLLPLPDRSQLDLSAYSDIGIMHGESRSDVRTTTIVTSRGCPARCCFCSIHSIWGHRFRAASAKRVAEEIGDLYHRKGIRHLLIEDDNFTLDKRRAKRILRTLARDYPDISWSAPNGVAIWSLDEELIRLIAETRCRRLSLAVESGCAETLKHIIGKPLDLEQVETVVRQCRRYRIQTTAFFVLGIPGETREAMEESMDFAARLDVDTLTVMTAVPLPGSPLYRSALTKGWMPADTPFSSYTTRSPMLTTSDFDPGSVDRLARKTMLRHAMRHPGSYVSRIYEKISTSPLTTVRTLTRTLRSSFMLLV